jgi:dolichol kinase|tara:strand:- start:1989 stop:2582 length:594 start_codon:yes stop_codon:yes gene_type:complete
VNRIPSNEINRKIIHFSSILIPASYLWFIKDQYAMILLLSGLTILALSLELLRNKLNFVNSLFNNIFFKMLRKNEQLGKLTGATWMLISSLIITVFFPIYIVVPALIYLSVGDSFAAIIGKAYPYGKLGKKSITGTISGFIFSSIFALLVNVTLPAHIIILGSLIAMIVEASPIKLNDNLTIPIISALSMKLSLSLL